MRNELTCVSSRERQRRLQAGRAQHGADEERAEGAVAEPESGAGDRVRKRRAAERRLADRAHAPGRGERPRDRADPAREERERDEEAADEPDRVLERVPERPGGAVADDGHREQEPEEADRDDRRRHREAEEERMHHPQVDPEEEAAPEERRGHAVDPDRRHRDGDRKQDEREVRRRGDDRLERPFPALALDRRARGHARRRPDAHHARAERGVEERRRVVPGPEHEERRGGEEERPDDAEDAGEGAPREDLQVQDEPEAEQPEGVHSLVTSATYASSRVGSREETRPTLAPSSRASSVCVTSRSPSTWTTSTWACSRSSTATARTPSTTRRRSTASSAVP